MSTGVLQMRFAFRHTLWVAGMALIGAYMAWWAPLGTGLCRVRPEVCALPPRPLGIYAFFIAAWVLFSACLDAVVLLLSLRRASSLEAVRTQLVVCLATVAVSGFLVFFYLWFLGMNL